MECLLKVEGTLSVCLPQNTAKRVLARNETMYEGREVVRRVQGRRRTPQSQQNGLMWQDLGLYRILAGVLIKLVLYLILSGVWTGWLGGLLWKNLTKSDRRKEQEREEKR